MSFQAHLRRKAGAGVVAAALVVGSTVGFVVLSAVAASAATSPIADRDSNGVTADALPTVQIDGVVWSQAVIGNTVYAGGKFANARPAGAAAGTNLTARGNLLSYDITTGVLNTNFAPTLNGQVKAVAASPDGKRIYVGGSFTTANGLNRYRIAAYDTTTGNVITSFAPGVDSAVNAIYATDTAVYVGGTFSKVGSLVRNRLAAFSATNGALLPWDPNANNTVNAITGNTSLGTAPSKIIVGGAFTSAGGVTNYGLAATDPTTGASLSFAVNQSVQNSGSQAAILSLTTDGTAVYGTGYVYGANGNLEGAFSADPNTGAINWIEDCHGDTYGLFAAPTAVYTVSHAHYCGNIGGFPQPPSPWVFHRSMSFTKTVTGTIGHDPYGYHDWFGTPSPSIIDWFPELEVGSVTGQSQAAWTVTGNSQYVVEGGEFPIVNGVAQQGLVRFAVPSIAPNKSGPQVSGSNFTPSLLALSSTSVRVAWQSNWDRDDQNLTYKVVRNGAAATPIYTVTAPSTVWNRPSLGFIDTGLTPGVSVSYRLYATDPSGNQVAGDTVTITPPASLTQTAYAGDVSADGASHSWPLGESSGTVGYDYAAFDDLTVNGSVARGAAGPITGSNTATTFDGSSSFAANQTAITGPNTFTEEAWFQTATTAGGKIVGFGNMNTGNSSHYDRHVYMDAAGHLNFGVYNNGSYVITTPKTYNDGKWHQVVGTLSSSGMVLYVDGVRIGRNTNTTIGEAYNGYWRIGGDSSWSGSNYFSGNIADVSVYSTALNLTQVQKHYSDAGGTLPPGATAPADKYGKAVYGDSPDVYYRLDESAGPTATDASPNGGTGNYVGGETFGAATTVTGPTGTAVTFDGKEGSTLASPQVSNPTTYSEELWFKTSTNKGGKLIGFGSSASGRSNSYDRHVYMDTNGRLNFGTYNGNTNIASSANAGYNDGQWHYLVATQGSDGMKLYVDNVLVGTNSHTDQQAYNGYWRIGGDTAWNNTAFFAGTIDEAAVYSSVLTAAQVSAHYAASSAAVGVPTASFTSTATGLAASFDASGSTVSGATITGYAWDFGDGTTGTGVTPTHNFAGSGTYTVSLTVTASNGMTNTMAKPITVTKPNVAPTAAFTSTINGLGVVFDGTGSSDSDGSIASYAWDFGDSASATTASPSHTYAANGTYTVTLTVTDNGGLTNTVTNTVTVKAPNVAPTAAFTSTVNNLDVVFDGTGSSDSDGSIASYAWDFGDGSTSAVVSPSHSYSSGGTYTVTLVVTDNEGLSSTVTHSVAVLAANVLPTAAFTFTTNGLSASVDASNSSDSDGTIASYAWDFGDGGTATTKTATHAFAAAGSYSVVLTVTDNRGGTGTATTTVTVSGPAVVAADTFGRTTAAGAWGTSDVGGPWTVTSSPTVFSVSGGSGIVRLTAAGNQPLAMLNNVSSANLNLVTDVAYDQAATGGGQTTTIIVRHVGKYDYRIKERLLVNGVVHLAISKVVNGTETTLKEINVTGLNYQTGNVLRLRVTVSGNGTSTTLTGKIWQSTGAEPAAAQISQADTDATLQGAGSVGILSSLSSTSTTVPVVVTYDNLSATALP